MLLEFPGRKEAIFLPVHCTSYIHPFIYPSNKHFLEPTVCFALLCDGTMADRKDMALKEPTNRCYSLLTKAIRVQRAVGKSDFWKGPVTLIKGWQPVGMSRRSLFFLPLVKAGQML